MPFSFLNPWFWLGALAVAAPVWLHLRRRSEQNLVRFSALRFLEDLPMPRRSPLRLQQLLLFALRVLALVASVAAFAWPYRNDLLPNPVDESRVYILDNTLSHQASDGFARDRARIINEIGRLSGAVQAAVIELSAQPRVVIHFGDDRASAKRRLLELRSSHQRGSYLAAFREANLLLANSLGDRKRLIFYGDNQENQWAENMNSPPFLRDVEVDLPRPPMRQAPSLFLSEPRLQRIFLGDQSQVNLTAKLSHFGEAKTCQLTLRVDGRLLLDREIELQGQPETIALQTQWDADPTRWIQGEMRISGAPDALASDNQVFFTLPPVVEGRVALLAQSPYLRLALSPDIMRGHWQTQILDATQLGAEAASNQDAEVLCLEAHYLQSTEVRKLVWRYLTNGRGVILFVNRVTPVIAGALRELGFDAHAPSKQTESAAQPFRYVFSQHPIFHPFLSPDYGNLMEIRVSNHARLKAMQGLPLIFSGSGDALFFEGTKFPGKLFVAAFGLEREQTTWPTHLTFIPFLDLCLQNSRPEDTTPTTYEPGQVAVLNLASESSAREAVLRSGKTEVRRVPLTQGRAQIPMPDQPGLYALSSDDGTEAAKVFAVNPSPKESQLHYAESPDALEVWRMGESGAASKARTNASRSAMTLASILQQDFWWWLLLTGLAALTLETTWTAKGGNEGSNLSQR